MQKYFQRIFSCLGIGYKLTITPLFVSDTIKEQDLEGRNGTKEPYSAETEPLTGFLSEFMGEKSAAQLFWIESDKNLEDVPPSDEFTGLGVQQRLNDFKKINLFLQRVNRKLYKGQYIAVRLETKNSRKQKIFERYPSVISYPYYFIDFGVTRVLPKLSLTKNLYLSLTKGKNKVIPLTEGLARMVYNGFKIIDFRKIDGLTYILAQKTKEPCYDSNPSFGLLVKLCRIGQDGKILNVYKIRTMHAYSEYLQEYMFDRFGTEDGDKIENDFRKAWWGKIFRKYWIDEIPMIWNLLKGEVKLVGVRPLSKHKYDTYPEYLQKKRIKTKPGMIPPFYADLPKTSEEFFETENRYLESYFKDPVKTDIRYFLKSCYNIILKGHRSR